MPDTQIRLAAFFGTFAVMFLLETLLPRRKRVENRTKRTLNNLAIASLNTLLLRIIPILSAMGVSSFAESRGWGLLNLLALPVLLEFILAIVILDLVIYWQHVASHKLPVLWMVHKVHHADHDLDASSGLRFHPIEILFSMGVKCVAVFLLGASPESVLAFEVILNCCAVFNHSNVAIPEGIDRLLRFLVVTPDMHRIHHSIHRDETESNYGFNIPLWDRLFQTYRRSPREHHTDMRLGVPSHSDSGDTMLLKSMLVMPFEDDASEAA